MSMKREISDKDIENVMSTIYECNIPVKVFKGIEDYLRALPVISLQPSEEPVAEEIKNETGNEKEQ